MRVSNGSSNRVANSVLFVGLLESITGVVRCCIAVSSPSKNAGQGGVPWTDTPGDKCAESCTNFVADGVLSHTLLSKFDLGWGYAPAMMATTYRFLPEWMIRERADHGGVLVLSPHFDDAVMSCGELIESSPGTIVATVCSASPGARTRSACRWRSDVVEHARSGRWNVQAAEGEQTVVIECFGRWPTERARRRPDRWRVQ